MAKSYSTQFPWVGFLWNSILWALISMIVLSVFFWFFTPEARALLAAPNAFSSQIWTILTLITRSIIFNLFIALIVLIPSFYLGMFACTFLEKKGGRYKSQFILAFRTGALLYLFILFLLWGAFTGFNLQISPEMGFTLFQMLIVTYFFDNNVTDNLWEQIFEKR